MVLLFDMHDLKIFADASLNSRTERNACLLSFLICACLFVCHHVVIRIIVVNVEEARSGGSFKLDASSGSGYELECECGRTPSHATSHVTSLVTGAITKQEGTIHHVGGMFAR